MDHRHHRTLLPVFQTTEPVACELAQLLHAELAISLVSIFLWKVEFTKTKQESKGKAR